MKTGIIKASIIISALLAGAGAHPAVTSGQLRQALSNNCVPGDETACYLDANGIRRTANRLQSPVEGVWCSCPPGKHYDAYSAADNPWAKRYCKPCPIDTYADLEGARAACIASPEGMACPEGASSLAQCDCKADYDWWPENGVAGNTAGACMHKNLRPFDYRRIFYKEVP